MSDFVKKVQVDNENKFIGLDENAIDAGLKLQDEKVALSVAEDTGLGFNAGGELELRFGNTLVVSGAGNSIDVALDSSNCISLFDGGLGLQLGTDLFGFHDGLTVRMDRFRENVRIVQEKTEIKVKTKGGLKYENNELSLNISSNVTDHSGIYIDGYGHPHIAVDKACGEWLKLNTEGLRLDTELMKKELGGGGLDPYVSVKIDPYGGLKKNNYGIGIRCNESWDYLRTDDRGLFIDTCTLHNDFARDLVGYGVSDPQSCLVVRDSERDKKYIALALSSNQTKPSGLVAKENFPMIQCDPVGGCELTSDGLKIKIDADSALRIDVNDGLTLDTAKLMEEIKNHFDL